MVAQIHTIPQSDFEHRYPNIPYGEINLSEEHQEEKNRSVIWGIGKKSNTINW